MDVTSGPLAFYVHGTFYFSDIYNNLFRKAFMKKNNYLLGVLFVILALCFLLPAAFAQSASYDKYLTKHVTTDLAVTLSEAQDCGHIPTTRAEFVSALLSKTGAGKGTAKLQGTLDGTNWTDLPGAAASATVAAGTAVATMYATTNIFPLTRVLFTEDGTGTATVVDMYWATK